MYEREPRGKQIDIIFSKEIVMFFFSEYGHRTYDTLQVTSLGMLNL